MKVKNKMPSNALKLHSTSNTQIKKKYKKNSQRKISLQ